MTDTSSSSPIPASAAGGDIRPVSSNSGGETDTSVGRTVHSDAIDAGRGERKPENKQKRKRTSPEDQLVLEAFYKENPKPNKAARAEILKDVKGMNEKEVQIWFQNRRQINRRKQRPLLPHEIAAFGLGGMAALSSDPVSSFSNSQNLEQSPMSSPQEEAVSSQESTETSRDLHVSPTPQLYGEHDQVKENKSEEVSAKSSLQMSAKAALETQVLSQPNDSSSTVSQSVTQSFSSTPGYLANRWNAVNSPWSTPVSSQQLPFTTPSISYPSQPLSCPERIGGSSSFTPPSQVRLSMSLDGKAEIVTTDLSPPRILTARPSSSGSVLPRRRMLQRSHSALSFGPVSRKSLPVGATVPRLATGRSRDARTWEFCCDGEVRDELTTQAENESTGSAVAAISLLRSTSNSALKSNTNKRNTPVKQSSRSAQDKKPKMGRAMSSLARLQSTGSQEPSGKGKGKDRLMRSPSGDSDKENWSPTESEVHLRRRPLPSGREKKPSAKRALGDNFNVPTHAMNFGGATNRNKRRKSAHKDSGIFEDEENGEGVGEEVEKFMRGEISPSKKGDLDCVQGLLSLSQGNWR